jgi:hypothetical protein
VRANEIRDDSPYLYDMKREQLASAVEWRRLRFVRTSGRGDLPVDVADRTPVEQEGREERMMVDERGSRGRGSQRERRRESGERPDLESVVSLKERLKGLT